jgi:hypothetical protein
MLGKFVMNTALERYIITARTKGHTDNQIKQDLIEAGWDEAQVVTGLKSAGDLVPPPPPPPGHVKSSKGAKAVASDAKSLETDSADKFIKVVPYRSTAGLEYIILFISLWVAAMSLAAVLHGIVDMTFGNADSFYEGVNSFATAALLVSLPIFSFLFLRLKKQEIVNPDIRRDINRKNAVQLTLIVTFLIGLGKTIFYIYQLLNIGNSDVSTGVFASELFHTIITVGISGLIFVYYWIDDHKKVAAS